jgi:general secretion pathway protein G
MAVRFSVLPVSDRASGCNASLHHEYAQFRFYPVGDRSSFSELHDPMVFRPELIVWLAAGLPDLHARPRRSDHRDPAKDSSAQQYGFTLLELLVVLAILGLLIGLVAPAALRQLESSKEKIAHQSIERIAGVLDIYKLDVGTYPTTEQGLQALIDRPSGVARWNGPYLKGVNAPEDPWGRPFIYHNPSQRTGHDYDLYSLGRTGQPGGTGDAAMIYNE